MITESSSETPISRVSEITLASPTDLSSRRLSNTLSDKASPKSSSSRRLSHTPSEKSPFKLKKLQSAVQDPEKGLWKCRHCPHEYAEPNPSSRVRRHHKKICPGQSGDEGEDSISHDVSGHDSKTDDNRGSTSPNTPEIQSKYKGPSERKATANLLDKYEKSFAAERTSQMDNDVGDVNLVDVKDDLVVMDNTSREKAGVNWMDVNDDLIIPRNVSQGKPEVNWIDADDDLFPNLEKSNEIGGEGGEIQGDDRQQPDAKLETLRGREYNSLQIPSDGSNDGVFTIVDTEKELEGEDYSRGLGAVEDGPTEFRETATEMDKQHQIEQEAETPAKAKEDSSLQRPKGDSIESVHLSTTYNQKEIKEIVQENDSKSANGAGNGDVKNWDETDHIGDSLREESEADEDDDSNYEVSEVDQKSDNDDEYQSMDSAVYASSGVASHNQFKVREYSDAQTVDEWEQGDEVLPQESGSERQPDYLGWPGEPHAYAGEGVQISHTGKRDRKELLDPPSVVEGNHDTDTRELNVKDQDENDARLLKLANPEKELQLPGDKTQVIVPKSEKLGLEDGSKREERQNLLHSNDLNLQQESSLPGLVEACVEAKRSTIARFEDVKTKALKREDEDELGDIISEGDSSEEHNLSMRHAHKNDIEKILRDQKTFDLICPACGSRITHRVILRKRRRRFISKEDLHVEKPIEIKPEVLLDEKENAASPNSSGDAQKDAPGCFGYFPLFAR